MFDLLKNKLDAPATVICWLAFTVVRIFAPVADKASNLPFIGQELQNGYASLSSGLLMLAISLTCGLLANLIWVWVYMFYVEPDPKKATPPGELNWLVTLAILLLVTILRAIVGSVVGFITESFYWHPVLTVLGVVVTIAGIIGAVIGGIALFHWLSSRGSSASTTSTGHRRSR